LSRLNDMLWDYDHRLQEPLARLREATNLTLMVMGVWTVVWVLAVRLLEEGLTERAQQPEAWPVCPSCGRRLRSKGFRERVLRTLFGVIPWWRRVGRCPNGCAGSQIAPLGSGIRVVAAPTHGGGSAVEGLSVGGVCAV